MWYDLHVESKANVVCAPNIAGQQSTDQGKSISQAAATTAAQLQRPSQPSKQQPALQTGARAAAMQQQQQASRLVPSHHQCPAPAAAGAAVQQPLWRPAAVMQQWLEVKPCEQRRAGAISCRQWRRSRRSSRPPSAPICLQSPTSERAGSASSPLEPVQESQLLSCSAALRAPAMHVAARSRKVTRESSALLCNGAMAQAAA